ncbi:phosphatase PAP2 family protein [Marivirga arenosa]|uniref:Phosphatase PAP2 family protein n=1 Tax=Marivirga arenosa TaxID=3059076 RepID=A0AA51R8M9_9BACT|nr:phosphatase PAP2 family protein [Marivirga sp. ABR2-2]WMN06786.1 phosphatase PAP2 family protein [Marivirga sp. ABR2-2]
MESIKDKLQSPAFLMFVLYFLTAISLVLFFEKGTFILWLNQKHNPFGDSFFSFITLVGEWHIFVVVGIILLMYRFYYAILLTLTGLIHFLIIQFLKIIVFKAPRPADYYADKLSSFNLVEGVDLKSLYAMPSGHTASAFALATILILITKNKLLQVIYMLIAILVAVSRVYLFQHFMVDTLVGASIGLLVSAIIWWYLSFKNKSLLYNNNRLHRGLIFNK